MVKKLTPSFFVTSVEYTLVGGVESTINGRKVLEVEPLDVAIIFSRNEKSTPEEVLLFLYSNYIVEYMPYLFTDTRT